jgi:hypothetical protein
MAALDRSSKRSFFFETWLNFWAEYVRHTTELPDVCNLVGGGTFFSHRLNGSCIDVNIQNASRITK